METRVCKPRVKTVEPVPEYDTEETPSGRVYWVSIEGGPGFYLPSLQEVSDEPEEATTV